jgi:hypothetical protein
MKKYFLALCLFIFASVTSAQNDFPSYPKIIKTYFKRYTKGDYENLLNFAKKKDGWYYQRVNPIKSNHLITEEKFWGPETGYNANLSADKKEVMDSVEIIKDYKEYLRQTNSNPWYGYERCRYFGYTGWEYDMIKDFGKEKILSDTLLEGLAKAYSSLAVSYLWYQQGGEEFKIDTLQRQLERLEIPSLARLDKVEYNLGKSIEIYERLKQQNPSYVCLVGNVSLKKFNEAMHGYMQMMMSLQMDRAAIFLNSAYLEKEYATQAKNYLNSCDSNAILFTYGDNDTYQLWYVQEKENFRKDVSVINTSLLGMPVYLDMLKKNNTVSFRAMPAFYGKKESDYIYYQTESPRPRKMELQKFLQDVYVFKKTIPYIDIEGKPLLVNAFNVKDVIIRVSPKLYNKHSSFKTNDSIIKTTLKDYVLMNDILMLDIVATNINSRPVYFTSAISSFFDSNFVQQGIVFKLFPKSKNNIQLRQQEIKRLEYFTDNLYKPVIQFTQSNATHLCFDGNNTFFQLYSKIGGYYKEKHNYKAAKLWLDKCFRILPSVNTKNFPGAYFLIETLQGINKEKLKGFCESYAAYCFEKYTNPSAAEGYMPQDECEQALDSLLQLLQDEEIESEYIDNFISRLLMAEK